MKPIMDGLRGKRDFLCELNCKYLTQNKVSSRQILD
jgi:hypothetical protein